MKRISLALALAGTSAFLVAVFLTVTDIILRSFSGMTVYGLTDIVTLCTMIGAMLAIPRGFAAEEHVAVDVFTARMPLRAQNVCALVAALLALIFLAAVAWFGCQQMMREYAYGDRSQSIGIPMIFYWLPLVTGMAVAALANLWLVVRYARAVFGE
ncbi:TRAP transporter small permease [Nitratireductor sp. GCM10026969]|uniref:TRAP transporter small permease n=1 Tax=Nitratireductor sp. GCM10026969 TaxID=3252645 RepID=UPI003613F1DE